MTQNSDSEHPSQAWGGTAQGSFCGLSYKVLRAVIRKRVLESLGVLWLRRS